MKSLMMFEVLDKFSLPSKDLQGEIISTSYFSNENIVTQRCEVDISGDNPDNIRFIFHNLDDNTIFFGRTDIVAIPVSYNNHTIEMKERV